MEARRAMPAGWRVVDGGRAKALSVTDSHEKEIAASADGRQCAEASQRTAEHAGVGRIPGATRAVARIVSTAIRSAKSQGDVAAALAWPADGKRVQKLCSGEQPMALHHLLVLGTRGCVGLVADILDGLLAELPDVRAEMDRRRVAC